MTDWSRFFAPGGDSSGSYSDGGLAPEDVIASQVKKLLSADPVLKLAFAGRIERMESRNPFDLRTLPRLQVYTSTTTESQRPTAIDVNTVRVYVGLRFDALAVGPVADDAPTIASPRRRVLDVLKDNPNLRVVVDGAEIPLAQEVEFGPVSWPYDVLPSSDGDRVAGTIEQAVDYRVWVHHASGRIKALRNARINAGLEAA